jgi:DNA-binding CsgD family transcriptional regulator
MAKLTQTSPNSWLLKFVGEADLDSLKSHFFVWHIDDPTADHPRPLAVNGQDLTLDLTTFEPAAPAEFKFSLTLQSAPESDTLQSPATPLAQVTLWGNWLPLPATNGASPFNLYYPVYLPGSDQKLTRREGELLALLAGSATNRAIAEQLVISHNTVKTHLKHLRRKLAATSRAEIVSRARELGVL